jgi:lipoyl synthase
MRLSIGSAATLGLADMHQSVEPTTCYVMLGGRCGNGCAFCSQQVASDRLSRIEWPAYDSGRAVSAINASSFKRVCLQCTSGSAHDTAEVLAAIHKPVSVSANLTTIDEVMQVASADRICIPLDVADKELYEKLKHGSFDDRIMLLRKVARLLPGKIMTHLIVGLGESEEEMADTIQMLVGLGIGVGLFAFTPIAGTMLSEKVRPTIAYYRRMQETLYTLQHGTMDAKAYETSGCPGCNRPFYNERVSGPLYNYPRPLTEEEYARCRNGE